MEKEGHVKQDPKIFFFKQKPAYEIRLSLVGSESGIRDRPGRADRDDRLAVGNQWLFQSRARQNRNRTGAAAQLADATGIYRSGSAVPALCRAPLGSGAPRICQSKSAYLFYPYHACDKSIQIDLE